MNFSTTNWRDRRNFFRPTHYSISNYCTETKNEMKSSFGEELFLPNLHLIPDPLMKNLADTIITEGKMAPKSKSESNIDVKSSENMQIPSDYSPLSGITSFFSGVVNVISNAMFSKRKQNNFGADMDNQMAAPPMWQSAKVPDENKILQDEKHSHDSDLLVSEMTDCRSAVTQCQNKIEQVRMLLGSKPVPCNFRTRRRPKKVFVEASSVEDCFEDAFSPEDFENIANNSYIQYSSPVCYHDHVFHEVDSPKVKVETAVTPEEVAESLPVCETTEIVTNVPETVTVNVNKFECDTKQEVVASCEDKLSRLKALLQERRKNSKTNVEPEPVSVPELNELQKAKPAPKLKDKRFKNPNRNCGKRMKSKMRKNIQDDLQFANEIYCDDLSSVENSPSMNSLEKYIAIPKTDKDYFNEVSGRFHSASVTESEDSFQIVFNDSPKQRRPSDCESEDSFIIFEDSPDSCYTSNDVFGDSSESDEYDSDSDLSDSGCGNMSFKLAASLSKSVCNLADDSLYAEPSEDEVDCANVKDMTVCESVTIGDLKIDGQCDDFKSGLLLNDRKKLLRKGLPAKRKITMVTVPEFYRGKSIFITGGTGFVGKALIEKLLRCCPDFGTIYLLMRPKKGVNTEERLKDLFNKQVFDLAREKNPDGFKKIKVINGDITEDGLGISEEDKKELQKNCNIVFHSAACVRFDQKLKDAVNMNTTGTWRVLTLAETMENLEVFVHLSTAYCRCDLDVLDEKVYPAVHKPRKIMDIVQWMDDNTLKYLEPKLISSEPNTYSYTKAITEDLVAEYGSKFPVAIARPSIVTAAWKEPMIGWVDNLNGPTGLVIGSGKGVIRTMHCEPSYKADAISVDVVANACILVGYVTALDKPKETQVYNLTLSGVVSLTWAEIIQLGEKWVNEFPYTVALWYPGGSIKSYKIIHQLDVFFSHIIPAYLVDGLLFLLGKKTFLVNLQKRISHGLNVLQYYTTKEWDFRNNNYKSLRSRVSAEDNEVFYTDLAQINPDEYLKNYVLGTRQFCCKEDPSNLPRARRLHKMRYFADRLLKLVFFALLIWTLYNNTHIFTSSVELLDTTLKSIPPIHARAEELADGAL